MNWPKAEKNILLFLLLSLAVVLPLLSLDSGISGDEEVHLKHSHKVISYFTSFGEDKSAINTPITKLKYYGQSFDNITTVVAELFNQQDIYTIRHICNSLVGWLCILFAALIAININGYRAAIFTVLLLSVSPRFIGHSFNNLKDVPFALGYIASLYYIIKINKDLRHIKWKHAVGVILSMAFMLSIRPGGLLVFCYFLLFSGISLILLIKSKTIQRKVVIHSLISMALICITAYFIGLLFWPYALENIILHPLKSMSVMTHYPITIRQLFEGELYWSDHLPWYYLIKYVSITVPLLVLPFFLFFILRMNIKFYKTAIYLAKGFLLFSILFPLTYTIIAQSNVYGAWRHLLFIYPPLVVMAGIGLSEMISVVKFKALKISILGVFVISLLSPLQFIYKNHPVEYTYFNELAGDFKKVADNYELDYYYHSVGEASKWLKKHIEENNIDSVKISSNYAVDHYFKNCTMNVSFNYVPYYARGNKDWDYGIFYRTTISPSQTRQSIWPPTGTIKCIEVEEVPVCVIVKRTTKDDYLGKIGYDKKNYSNAESLFMSAIKIDPGSEIAWINLGKTYLKQNKYSDAKSAFEQCLSIFSNYEPAMYYLAKTEIQLNNPEKALEHYGKILEANCKSFKTYLAYAKLYNSLSDYKNAIEVLDECLYWNPHYKHAEILRNHIVYTQKLKHTD